MRYPNHGSFPYFGNESCCFLVLLLPSTLRFDLIRTATQTEIKRPRVVAVMDVPVARYRRSRWMEGPTEGRTLFLQEKWPLSELLPGSQMKILLTSHRLVARRTWTGAGPRDGRESNKIFESKRDDKILAAREKPAGSPDCLFIQGFSSV